MLLLYGARATSDLVFIGVDITNRGFKVKTISLVKLFSAYLATVLFLAGILIAHNFGLSWLLYIPTKTLLLGLVVATYGSFITALLTSFVLRLGKGKSEIFLHITKNH